MDEITEAGQVTSKTANGVTTISFSHPKSNSLPASMLAQLAKSVEIAGIDPETRVIVICSEGTDVFCAGASFSELQTIRDAASGTELLYFEIPLSNVQ